MSHILDHFETADVVTAIENNLVSYWMNYGRTPQGKLYDEADCAWFSTGIPTPLYNGIVRSQFSSDSINASIDNTLSYFAQNQLPIVWWTTPTTQPITLETSLEIHGLTRIMELPGMAIDLHTFNAAPAIDNLDILTVQNPEMLKQWVNVAMIGFDTPAELFDPLFAVESEFGIETTSYKRYLAIWQGQPVAISALYLDAEVAGIYFVATVPEARQQGIGRAVTQAALLEARNLGYRLAILQASPMGAPVYARMGFQEYCKLGLYLWQPTSNQRG